MASFFDDLFSGFTGSAGVQGAQQQRELLSGVFNNLGNINQDFMGRSLAELETGKDNSVSALNSNFGDARSAINRGATQGIDFLNTNMTQPLQQTAGMYSDALGLGGAAGNTRATGAFQAGPGYNFMRDQGLESVARNANAAGMLAGGNMLQESQRYGSGLANQEFNNWRNALGQREGLYAPLAARQADMYQTQGQNLANLSAQQGLAAMANYGSNAQQRADTYRQYLAMQNQLASSMTGNIASTFSNEANAITQGSNNIWGAVGNIARTAAGFV